MSKKISLPIVNPDFQDTAAPGGSGAESPKTRAEGGDIQSEIARIVSDNRVHLFMKGTPQMPMCGFSARVVQILDHLGATYSASNVLEDPEMRQGIKDFTDWPTIPQLYVDGEFVGGCDIVTEMFQTGELKETLAGK